MAKAKAVKDNGRLRRLVGNYLAAEQAVAQAAEHLAGVTAAWRQVAEQDLPALMAELGQAEATLADGTRVKVGEHLSASVSERNLPLARKIFHRLKAGDLVQVQVTAAFGPADVAALTALRAYSARARLPLAERDVVNPASLKAWVREQRSKGRLQPQDLEALGVFVVNRAEVKRPKELT